MRRVILGMAMPAVLVSGFLVSGCATTTRQDVREARGDLRDAQNYGDREDRREARQELRETRRERREDRYEPN